MSGPDTSIDLCLCTYRRPAVADTLRSVGAQHLPPGVRLRVIVVDNDDTPGARATVTAVAATMALPVDYLHAPGGNISGARNAGLARADADWIAFLDDDETVGPGWLDALVRTARRTGADAVFGPSVPVYDADAPRWMRVALPHAQPVPARRGVLRTGHTCNALVRWRGTPWADTRFDPAFGRSGGEDTAFFAELLARGARFAGAPDATAHERIPPARARFGWLARRRFRIGQTNGRVPPSPAPRALRLAAALAKACLCGIAALALLPQPARRNPWALRGIMHLGVCAGCLSARQAALYGPGATAP